jgi:hypothetical protein
MSVTLSPEKGVLSQDSCDLGIREGAAGKAYRYKVTPGLQSVYAEVPEGSYFLVELDCGQNKRWDFTAKTWPPILVQKTKLSFTAPMEFRINVSGGMTTFFSNKNIVQKNLSEAFGRLQPETQKGVVSAYNRQAITAKMLLPSQYQISVKLSGTHKPGEPEEATYPEFKACYDQEFTNNPLYVGFLNITTKFDNKKMTSMTLGESENTYSKEFTKCYQEKLKAFVPNRSDSLIYEIVL